MFKNLLVAAACAGACAFTTPMQAQELEYTTTCRIEDGEAVGYLSVRRPASLSFGGEIDFYIYNEDNERIDEVSSITTVTVTNSDLVAIDAVDVDSDAFACAIDITKALDDPDTERLPFMTTCDVDDGTATGYVQLTNDPALRFSGRIRFLMFDEDGRFLEEYLDNTSFVLVGRDRREVKSIDINSDAFSCTLDLSDAL
jgi:hypothetical protein